MGSVNPDDRPASVAWIGGSTPQPQPARQHPRAVVAWLALVIVILMGLLLLVVNLFFLTLAHTKELQAEVDLLLRVGEDTKPSSPLDPAQVASRLRMHGDYRSALAIYDELLSATTDPDERLRIGLWKARTHFQAGDDRRAIETADRVVAAGSSADYNRSSIAAAAAIVKAEATGRLERVSWERSIDDLAARSPGDAKLMYRYAHGLALANRKRYREAAMLLAKLGHEAPDNKWGRWSIELGELCRQKAGSTPPAAGG